MQAGNSDESSSADATGNITFLTPTADAVKILSLNDLVISLTEDVYEYLAKQYAILDDGHAENPLKRHRQNNGRNCQGTLKSKTHLDKMMGYLKYPPADTCCRVNLISSSVDEVVAELTNHLKEQNSNYSYSIKQHEKIEDLVVIRGGSSQSSTGMDELYLFNSPQKVSSTRIEENELQLSALKKRRGRGWPMTHRVVVVDRFCGEAVLRGANIFVKGIICADAGIWKGEEIAVYADIRLSKSKSLTRGLLLENYSGRCVFLGIGISCCKRSEYFSQSTGIGVRMTQTAGPPQPPLNGVLGGKMMLQNLPSIVVGKALDPQKGDAILDMCCAPGGKTSHLASLMNNDGFIIACDKSRKKMISVRDFFQSMGATCIIPLALDSTKSLLELQSSQCWRSPKEIVDAASSSKKDGLLDVEGFYSDSFDRILLDPPCSALGLRPKLLIEAQTSADLMKHAEYQRHFVRNAIPLLKSGGTMTYSTCTINTAENEEMVKFILSEFPCMKLVPISPELPGCAGLPGVGLTDQQRGMVKRFDPSGEADTMGLFAAKFSKQ
mmetsp:Transcript_17380/g.36703  ORF Transcript_17380/g.36703 Transcript_17380/m.36703 type:complete len:552 (+) Transcript_17380:218-1873(+)